MKSRTLTVCFVTRITTDHSFGGMQYYTDLLAKGLAERGNKVHIITTARDKSSQHQTQIIERDNITTHFLAHTRPGSYRRGFFDKAYKRFCEINATEKIDLVHGQSAAGLRFGNRLSIPLVTSLFGVGYSETPYQKLIFPRLGIREKLIFLHKWPKITISMRMMYKAAAGSDLTIVISDFSKRELQRVQPSIPQENVKRIYCGIENVNFSLDNKPRLKNELGISGILVLSAGRVEVQKGVHLLLEAWSKLNYPDAHLVVVGDGSYLLYLKRYAHHHNIRNCTFTGKVPHETFLKYFGAADVFVYPELTQPAFGLVAAQSMTHGTPVIGSDHGAIPEVIGDAGLLFTPGSADDLKDKLDYFLDHKEIWAYLGRKGIQRVQAYFTIDQMVKETLGYYWELVKKKRK